MFFRHHVSTGFSSPVKLQWCNIHQQILLNLGDFMVQPYSQNSPRRKDEYFHRQQSGSMSKMSCWVKKQVVDSICAQMKGCVNICACMWEYPERTAQTIKNYLYAKWEQGGLGREDPLKEGMVTHSRILAWRVPWTEEPGGPQSMGSQRVGHDLGTEQQRSFHFSLCEFLCYLFILNLFIIFGCAGSTLLCVRGRSLVVVRGITLQPWCSGFNSCG